MRKMLLALVACSTISSAAEAGTGRIKFCFLFCAVEGEAAADSFCQAYERVIRDPGDSASLQAARLSLQKRTARNDALYRCQCEGWKNPICMVR